MKLRRYFASSFVAVLLSLLFVTGVSAGSVTTGGITLTWPNYPIGGPGLHSCEPWEVEGANTVTLTGIPEGATVIVTTMWANPYSGSVNYQPPATYDNVTGGTLVVPVNYPMDTTQWPVFNTTTNERAIAVAVHAQVKASGITTKMVGKQWWVRCLPPPAPAQGCTPGYWRQEQHFDSWVATGYAPGDDFNTVFGVSASFDPHSLLDAVWLGGGGESALARHAVAALLNASHPDVNYVYSTAEVIAGVQSAYASGDFEAFKNQLEAANEAGCSLN